eukprot:gnl/MRDRNA2_/MRDRNA2_50918_c0_seq1.p1 gnl/MRDRNA2_/MRDRNA2_50918_c0~~gnl/MRDRNA2_/MRDRNA2_50918_c0_seq1.p1  ORF type:complete len:238 (+),score=37.66 gnl/MRDRNA2_/MRDRNA2_50918_c0_seq1:91-714(+)
MSDAFGPFVEGASSHLVQNAEDLQMLLEHGLQNLLVECTSMERTSNDSSLVFMIRVASVGIEDVSNVRLGSLFLVEAAGSEHGLTCGKAKPPLVRSVATLNEIVRIVAEKKTAPDTGSRPTARQHINQRFVQFRSSKLTTLLKDSLGGPSSLVVIATCSPAADSVLETQRTLHFASLAKHITNYPRITTLRQEESEEYEKLFGHSFG